ncbi:MAG: hypothetical protein AABZ10_08500 [Nitrospirota bacterium]
MKIPPRLLVAVVLGLATSTAASTITKLSVDPVAASAAGVPVYDPTAAGSAAAGVGLYVRPVDPTWPTRSLFTDREP